MLQQPVYMLRCGASNVLLNCNNKHEEFAFRTEKSISLGCQKCTWVMWVKLKGDIDFITNPNRNNVHKNSKTLTL